MAREPHVAARLRHRPRVLPLLIASALVLDLRLSSDLDPVARLVRLLLRRPSRAAPAPPRPRRAVPRVQVGAGRARSCPRLHLPLGSDRGWSAGARRGAGRSHVVLLLPRRAGGQASPTMWQLSLGLVLLGLALTFAVEFVVVRASTSAGRTRSSRRTCRCGCSGASRPQSRCTASTAVCAGSGASGGSPGVAVFVLLFAATLLYPVLATRAKVRDGSIPPRHVGWTARPSWRRASYAAEGVVIPSRTTSRRFAGSSRRSLAHPSSRRQTRIRPCTAGATASRCSQATPPWWDGTSTSASSARSSTTPECPTGSPISRRPTARRTRSGRSGY